MQKNILVGTADGLHVVGSESPVQIAGQEVKSLAGGGSAWWAIVGDREVWRSSDGGGWMQVASLEGLRANCVLPTEAGPYIGTSEARIYAIRDEAAVPVHSFDETRGREDWHTPWGGPPDVRSMSEDPSGTVFVNVHVGGIVRSADGRRSWEPTLDIHSDVHQVLFDRGSGLLLAATARGLAVSADSGDTWRFDTEGLHAPYLRAVAIAAGTVLLTASTGPRTDRGAIYSRPLNSEGAFQQCRQGLPEWFADNVDTFCLAASGTSAAIGTSVGSVYQSEDEGESWTSVAEGLPPVRCVAFA